MTRPSPSSGPARLLRPPTPRERVLAAATEALLGANRAVPAPLLQRLVQSFASAPGRGRSNRP